MNIGQRLRRIEKIIEGKQVGTLYHFTSLVNLFKILDDNVLRSSESNGYLSLTRDFYSHKTIARTYSCCLVLDGDKISNNYKLEPFQDSYFGTSIKKKIQDEKEERLFKDLKNLNKYVKSITLFELNCEEEFSDWGLRQWVEIEPSLEDDGNLNDIVFSIKNNYNLKVLVK